MSEHIVIDEPVDKVDDAEIVNAANVEDIGHNKIPMSLGISENDTLKGKEFCKEIIQQIVDIRLPDSIKKRPELLRLVQLQTSFEEFTLRGMFAVVSQAVKLLTELTAEDAIYNVEGMIDTFKLQAVLNTQQHCMNLLQQFNTHMRRLPQVLIDMMHDIEYSQIIQVQAETVSSEAQDVKGYMTAKPLSVIMAEAAKEQEQAALEKIDDNDDFVEPVDDDTAEVPEEPEDISNVSMDD